MSKQNIQDFNVSEMQKAFKLDERKITSDKQNDEEIPVHWKLVQFGDVCSLRKETVQPSENQHTNYIGLEHIDSGTPYLNRWGTASEVTSSKSKFYTGDVLYGKLRPYLDKAIFAEFDGICSTDILVFVSSIQLISTFLSYFVHTRQFLDYAIQSTHGVNHPRTSWSSLAKYQFSLPPLPQQQAIAHVLQTVQEAIQTRRDELDLELECKAALMEYLFTHGARGETTKQTDVGKMPASWQFVRLGDVCNIRYGLGQPPALDSNGVPMIRATDIKGGRIVSSTVIRVKRDAIPEKRNPFLKRGDIIVVRSGAYTGDVAIYDGRWELAIAGYDLVVSPTNDEIDMAFMAQYLLGNSAQNYFRSQRDRSAQPHLNADQLSHTVVPLPLLPEQQLISQALNACDAKISTMEQEVTLLEELFRAFLDELMTGRLSTLPLIKEGGIHE